MENVKQIVIDLTKDGMVNHICLHHYDEAEPLLVDFSHLPVDSKHLEQALQATMIIKEVLNANKNENNEGLVEKEIDTNGAP